jgi:hypothetical protein
MDFASCSTGGARRISSINNKDNKINTKCFSANQAALGNKSND